VHVGVLSAVKLIDPNQRFAEEYNSERARNIEPAKRIKDIVNTTYVNEMDSGKAVLITNPKDVPAIAHVIMQGGRADIVMAAIDKALEGSKEFTVAEGEPLEVLKDVDLAESAGNRYIRLILSPSIAKHDVAVLYAWGGASDTSTELDLMIWPIAKSANEQL
jgi:hypothetical protein